MLKNMVAVVTGAVNGLGRQTLTHLCEEGANVFGCDIRNDEGEIASKFSDQAEFLQADVRSEEDMVKVFSKAIERFGRVDTLINCAGIGSAHLLVSSKTVFRLEDALRVFEINITGQFNASRLAAVEMSKNEPDKDGNRGVIILTSGFASHNGRRAQGVIGGSYGGVEGMTLPMSRDLGPVGIRVVTISPGVFRTPLTNSLSSEVKTFLGRCQAFPHTIGKPETYSQLVIEVIQNQFMNGEIVKIDGGLNVPSTN